MNGFADGSTPIRKLRTRLWLAFALALAGAAIAPATSVAAPPTCSYSAGTHTLDVVDTATGNGTVIRRQSGGNNIEVVDGATSSVVSCANGPATVTNTDTVNLTDEPDQDSFVSISLLNGAFAPGFTNEDGAGGDGTEEIEFRVDLGNAAFAGDILSLAATNASDYVQLGQSSGEGAINLNGLSAGDGDADDMRFLGGTGGTESVIVHGDQPNQAGAADTVNAAGGASYFNGPFPIAMNLHGHGGDDDLTANNITGLLNGGSGNDDMVGGTSNDDFRMDTGNDTADGNGGTDIVDYFFANGGVTVDLAQTSQQDTGGAGLDTVTEVENLSGSLFDDRLLGDAGGNKLDGGTRGFDDASGDDVLIGRGGTDALRGWAGTDTASYEEGATGAVNVDLPGLQATGGAGNDSLPDLSDNVTDSNVENPDGVSDVENVVGSPFGDNLTGSSLANRITGLGGSDTISALAGVDTILVRDGEPDTVSCGDPAGGAPADSVTADKQVTDSVNADCEQVDYLPPDPDADGDGVPDASDTCQNESGPASNNGCPLPPPPDPDPDPDPDSDGDGITDAADACADQPGPAANNGCPEGRGTQSDTDAPETTLKKSKLRGDDATLRFVSDEPGSRFECKLDKKAFKSCASPKRYRNLDDGKHKVLVVAIDAAGNRDASAAKGKFEISD